MQHKILVVEDEEIIRIGLRDNFELENYLVETAGDGEEAIVKAEAFQPDLVILDLMLPRKSGFEVCRVLRKKHPQVIIIMLTAKTEETSKVAGLEMGADDYVTKPFSILELLARVKAFLRRIQSQQGNGAVSSTAETNDIVDFAGIRLDFKKYEASRHGHLRRNERTRVPVVALFLEPQRRSHTARGSSTRSLGLYT